MAQQDESTIPEAKDEERPRRERQHHSKRKPSEAKDAERRRTRTVSQRGNGFESGEDDNALLESLLSEIN